MKNSSHREEILCHRKIKKEEALELSCLTPNLSGVLTAQRRLEGPASDHTMTNMLIETIIQGYPISGRWMRVVVWI